MKVENLKNYGRPYSETMTTLPEAVRKRVRREGSKVIRRHLGLLGLLRLLFLTWREKKRMVRTDLDPIRRRGLVNEHFINFTIQRTAMFSATAKMVGVDQALAIHREIMDEISIPMNEALLPSRLEFEGLDGLFGAFRQYMMAFLEAERKGGLHEYRIVEDSDDALAIDMTYCAFCEIPRHLGIMEACESGCYSDEVFFPKFLEPLGLRFVRTKTLARKGDRCDFRFERIPSHGSQEAAPKEG